MFLDNFNNKDTYYVHGRTSNVYYCTKLTNVNVFNCNYVLLLYLTIIYPCTYLRIERGEGKGSDLRRYSYAFGEYI